MKTFHNLNFFIVLIFLSVSCTSSKPIAAKFNNEQRKGRDNSNQLFIVTNDGVKITAKKLQYQTRTSLFPTNNVNDKAVLLDGKKVEFGQYAAIQTSYAYKILYTPENSSPKSKGIYISRLRSGKINLFHYEYASTEKNSWQKRMVYHEYYFQKENGQPETLNFENFGDVIRDNSKACDMLVQLFPLGEIPKTDVKKTFKNLLAIVDLYNLPTTEYLQVHR
ncbi:hypothetical protein BH11BAC5_BH11BAC5_54140 [soil metagenome]